MVDTIESLKHQLGLLGQALGNLLVAQGVIRNVPLTGPELLMIAEDYTTQLLKEKAEERLQKQSADGTSETTL